ncbi:MAG TPA: alpha/beta hydrolase [Vicinamibacterales bacterium]|nr:alpha/beta hydrolase [Vicinamibacterales bacterium]
MSSSTPFKVTMPDGMTLIGRDWPLPGHVTRRGAVLLIHGVGEHSGRYDHVADALHAVGLHVRGYDQRGFGVSQGPQGRLPWSDALQDDAQLMYAKYEADLAAQGESRPPFLLAHSMGGAVAARIVTARSVRPRGLILSSPAFDPVLSAAERGAIEFFSGSAPNLPLRHHIRPEQVTHDPDVIQAIKDDILMHNHVSPRLVMSIITAGQGALATAPTLTVPTLLQVAGSDSVVVPAKSRDFAQALPDGVGCLLWYEHLFHEIYNESPPDRARVLSDLQTWLKSQL